MDRPPTLGEQELAVLHFIAERSPVSAREVIDKFGEEQDLARTTILTKIERLRRKGFISRRRKNGVFVYSAASGPLDLLKDQVRDFVERTLGGSVSPMVAYLAESERVSDRDLEELERLARTLRGRREADQGTELP